MSKIELSTISSGYNLSKMNENFQKLEDALNDQVLYRDNPEGEDNSLQTDMDANNKRILNLPDPISASEPVRKQDLEEEADRLQSVADTNIAEIEDLRDEVQDFYSDAATLVNYQGYWQTGVSTSDKGMSWSYQGLIWLCNENGTTEDPSRNSSKWSLASSQVKVISSVFDTAAFTNLQEGDVVELVEYHPDSGVGGGSTIVRSARHNGGTAISLSRTRPTDWDDDTQKAEWFADSGVDEMCAVRTDYGAVDVKWFGAVGDGVTDDTPAMESARGDLSNPIKLYIPHSDNSYRVNNMQLGKECIIFGDGRYVSNVEGNGVDPVFLMGDGVESTWRTNQLLNIGITNDGASCVVGNYSPNYIIKNCNILSRGGDGTFNAVDFVLAPRGDFSENICAIVGDGWALSLRDNCNGQTVHHNIMTGGTSGGAIKAGISSMLSVKWNIIESSLKGVSVASTTDTGDGICTALEVDNNYFEQVTNPIVIGTEYSVKGWSVKGNIVSNADITTAAQSYMFGRVFNGEFSENITTVKSDGSENFIEFVLNQSADREGNVWKQGRLEGTPLSVISYSGTLASDGSTLRNLGSFNYFDFLGTSSSEGYKEYYSPVFTANVSTDTVAWINESILEWGGTIFGIEIIEKSGDLTGAYLAVGDSGNTTRLANIELDSTVFSYGYFDFTLTHPTNHIRKDLKNFVRNVAGTGTGTYRVKITYRAT